jgi:hypothetical protein
MNKDQLHAKYAAELGLFDNDLKSMISDLVNHTETTWDLFGIRYDTVMNIKEWEDFVTHPERIPYQSKIEKIKNKDINFVFEYIVEFLKDVFAYYKSLEDSEYKTELRKLINSLLETACNARFQIDELREADMYKGRSDEDRDAGKIEVLDTTINGYNYAITEYAKYANKDAEKLKQKILEICQNDLRKLTQALSICDLDYETRLELKGVMEILSRDLTLSFSDIKRGWHVWKIFRKIGIDVDEYLNLLGLPDYETAKRRLLNFVNNKEHVEEMLKHMQDDLPECYAKYQKQGYIERIDIAYENAKRKGYPKKIRSDEETAEMIKEVEQKVFELFPLAKNPTPRNIILNPTHPSSTTRAFNSTIKNKDGLSINIIVMTPRVDNTDDYLPTFAHEVTHAIHRKVLDFGERSGVLKKGSAESVTSAVMEDFSQLVDKQFKTDLKLPYKKFFEGKEFPTFWSGFVTRFQVPFSLIQLGIRKDFDEMYNALSENQREDSQLTEEQLEELKYKFDKLCRDWLAAGINIKSKVNAFNLFDSYNPRDGVVYMRTYMMQENLSEKAKTENETVKGSDGSEPKQMNMQEAFKKRFGEKWVYEKDARIILHWLLLETGRSENTESYYEFILNKDPKDCLAELTKINLNETDII